MSGLVPTFCVQADLIRPRHRNTLWPLRLDGHPLKLVHVSVIDLCGHVGRARGSRPGGGRCRRQRDSASSPSISKNSGPTRSMSDSASALGRDRPDPTAGSEPGSHRRIPHPTLRHPETHGVPEPDGGTSARWFAPMSASAPRASWRRNDRMVACTSRSLIAGSGADRAPPTPGGRIRPSARTSVR